MRSLYFVAKLGKAGPARATARISPEPDSLMFLSPSVVTGINPGPVQVRESYSPCVPKEILTKKVRVSIGNPQSWANYVLNDTYAPKSIAAVEKLIRYNGHLPSFVDVVQHEPDLGSNQQIFLQKVAKMMLCIIQQETCINVLTKTLRATGSRASGKC